MTWSVLRFDFRAEWNGSGCRALVATLPPVVQEWVWNAPERSGSEVLFWVTGERADPFGTVSS